ncbi:4'-phosphopantetheinyl transferase superfamily protein, partial [Vibrio sp. FNV 38]|nr:4'-phosphopantetheinyl transferase superfamily protein [Vibrio sp. FNV 38]
MIRTMDVRCGIDIADVSRFEKISKDGNTAFISKCFTGEEIKYCESSANTVRKAERYAARFAAKEAVGKALGTGLMSEGVGMHDI